MLFLLFQLGAERYALDASRVIEVLPLIQLEPLPQPPAGVAGMFNYRGEPMPVVDLSRLVVRRPAREHITTRIIVVEHPDAHGAMRRLGLIAENVTEVIRKEKEDFREAANYLREPPYLGPMLFDQRGIVRWIREEKLLANETRDAIYAERMAV